MARLINVTRSALPPREEFYRLIDDVFSCYILTNNGPKCIELEKRLSDFLELGQNSLTLCANGTLGLELALHAAGVAGKRVITTPFTYAATVTAPIWVGCKVDFADIDPDTLCIDPVSVAAQIRNDTAAVIPVNIYGYPCNDAGLREVCGKLPIIYDAAQAFGAKLNGRSLFDFGNFAVCSLHATKVMHTVEGGFVVSHSAVDRRKLCLLRAFGHDNENYSSLGINAKMSELHACMGLSLLDHYQEHLEARRRIDAIYRELLDQNYMRFPGTPDGYQSNYGYFPVIFDSEAILVKVVRTLKERHINPRRYFYPAISTIGCLNPDRQSCPVAEDMARRVLCLPIYSGVPEEKVEEIVVLVNGACR